MKKFILGLLTTLSLGYLQADMDIAPYPLQSGLEFRVSYFYPYSDEFRDLFPDGGVDYQLSANVPIYTCDPCSWLTGFNLWAAADYYTQNSHSEPLHDKISIDMAPITLGLKYFFPETCTLPVNFYVGSGFKYYFVHTHNNSDTAKNTINRNGLGGVVEAGFLARFYDNFFLDVFASYSFKTLGAPTIHNPAVEATGLNVSGWNVGGGVGYFF